jgi:hypothetical protein
VSADPVAGADIIESGAAAPALSWRRPTVAWAVIVALVVGGAAGYLLGTRHAGAPSASPSASPVVLSSAGPAVPPHLPALAGTGNRCAMQVGKRLQLSVEVVNGTAEAAVIDRVAAHLPLNGLREVDAAWGTCGQLTTGPPHGQRLEAGASGWLTVTFDVLVPCPAALPVGFVVQYEHGGQPDGTEVWGFSDLGDVSYSGCPAG